MAKGFKWGQHRVEKDYIQLRRGVVYPVSSDKQDAKKYKNNVSRTGHVTIGRV